MSVLQIIVVLIRGVVADRAELAAENLVRRRRKPTALPLVCLYPHGGYFGPLGEFKQSFTGEPPRMEYLVCTVRQPPIAPHFRMNYLTRLKNGVSSK